MVLVFGSINIDLVARVASIARPGETVLAESCETLFGGKGANQAVAASRALGAPHGRVAMVGRVGTDGFGESALANLKANGVGIGEIRRDGAPTGCAFISVDAKGENAIKVAVGANAHVTTQDVGDATLAAARVLVLQMEVPAAQSLAVARRALSRDVQVIWNLAPAPASLAPDLCREILGATDVLVVNEHEAMTFASAIGAPAPHYAEAATAIVTSGRCTVVVTAGAAGALAVFAEGRSIAAPALPVTPIDTTGAGDTFVGVLAAGLAEGRRFDEALARACRGASLACLALGAQAAMPDRQALDAPRPAV